MSYVSVFLKIFLISVGIQPNRDIKTKKIIFILIFVQIFLLLGEINAFFTASSNIYKFEIIYQAACFIYIGLTQLMTWHNRIFLLHICDRLEGNLPKFMGQNATLETEKSFKKATKIFVVVYFITIATYVMIPWVNFFVTGKNYGDPLSYPLPFWFAIWEINSVGKYVMMNVLQNVLCTFIFCVYACTFGFIACIMINCRTHLKEIESRVEMLNGSIEEQFEADFEISDGFIRYDRKELKNNFVEELVEIVRYRQVLLLLCEDVTKYLSWIFSAAIGWVILVMVLTLFITTQSVSDIVFRIKLMSVVTNVLFSFFFFCYVSEAVRQINERCLDSFYNIPWYHNTLKLRKVLLILLQQNQKNIEIKAFKMYTMNLSLFSHVLRVIYSCLNVMIWMQKK